MKKVLAVLVLVGVVCAWTTAGAAIKSTSLGNVVTRSAASDTATGDAQSWAQNNNRKDIGAGGTGYADHWGTPNLLGNTDYGADAMLAAYDRNEINSQITAAGPNWTAYMVLKRNGGTSGTPQPVVGVFKTDTLTINQSPLVQRPDLDWTSSIVNGAVPNSLSAPFNQWTSGGKAYANFEAMVRGSGTLWSVDSYTTLSATLGGNSATVMEMPIGQSLVNAYLNDPTMTGFFISNADPSGGVFNSNGGTQWSGGVGYMDLLIVATPEPATLCLLALGGLALLRRRHA